MAVLIDARDIDKFPAFKQAEDKTREEAKKLAKSQWGLDWGGMFPGDKQYGETSIRLPYFNLGTTSGTAETWNRNFTNTGWQSLIAGKKTLEDVIIGITGWEIASSTKRIAGIFQKYGERTFPIVNFETEAQRFANAALLFEEGIVINEELNVDVDVLVTAVGNQIIKPLGFAFVKKPLLISKKPV